MFAPAVHNKEEFTILPVDHAHVLLKTITILLLWPVLNVYNLLVKDAILPIHLYVLLVQSIESLVEIDVFVHQGSCK